MLEETLVHVIQNIKSGYIRDKETVRQGIVLPILHALEWNVWSPHIVHPHYPTEDGRVDYALCANPGIPDVFIEIKLDYAENNMHETSIHTSHTSAPLIVLTDGKTWSFRLSKENGKPSSKEFYKLNILTAASSEVIRILERYLHYSQVRSGQALKNARRDYHSTRKKSLILRAWQELVETGDNMLIELIAITAEKKSGIKPNRQDILEFLMSLSPKPREHSPLSREKLIIKGEPIYDVRTAKDAMVYIFKYLSSQNQDFLEKCYNDPAFKGSKRRYIARTPEELYPDSPHLWEYHEKLTDEWVIATNINNDIKKKMIRRACEIAGLKFGYDVIVGF